ncbi:putative exonuclease GOR [Blattella germanica]|nr:putative exonuclease GOR [Blattella germanica]
MQSDPPSVDYGVYALFCEMCYTTGGLELTRVTVFDRELDTVYESLLSQRTPSMITTRGLGELRKTIANMCAVVDTSVVFPHKMGPPKKRALKTLCWEHLNKIIQESESGHYSADCRGRYGLHGVDEVEIRPL